MDKHMVQSNWTIATNTAFSGQLSILLFLVVALLFHLLLVLVLVFFAKDQFCPFLL